MIVTSWVSTALPVSDAALGGYTYLLEILTGLVGSRRRWRTAPWLVLLFGLMIAPLATVLKPEDQLRKPGSAGKPAIKVETRVVDDQMIDVGPGEIGEIGEIVHRSPQLLLGYYHDVERTAAAFEGGWFHSGDLATIDDEGYIFVVDRKKDMIKTGGENVASREVEEALYRLAGISEVAVVGLPHPRWIEAVTAVVVQQPGANLIEAQVIAHCAAQLAHFKTPKAAVFVDALPKNPSGKLLKRELRLRFEGHFGV